jgi:hypothetical protein
MGGFVRYHPVTVTSNLLYEVHITTTTGSKMMPNYSLIFISQASESNTWKNDPLNFKCCRMEFSVLTEMSGFPSLFPLHQTLSVQEVTTFQFERLSYLACLLLRCSCRIAPTLLLVEAWWCFSIPSTYTVHLSPPFLATTPSPSLPQDILILEILKTKAHTQLGTDSCLFCATKNAIKGWTCTLLQLVCICENSSFVETV